MAHVAKARYAGEMRAVAGEFPLARVFVLALGFLAVGCRKDDAQGKPSPSSAPAASQATSARPVASAPSPAASSTYSTREIAGGRALEVRVTYGGKKRPSTLTMPPEFHHHCGGADGAPNESLDLDEPNLVNGAVVWIDDVREGAPLPSTTPTQDEKRCRFVPHVMAANAPSRIDLTNSDPANHVVKLDFGDDDVVKMIPPNGRVTLDAKPEWAGRVAKVTCPVHLWMSGWMLFFDHPYFAVTRGGVARIENVPPGKHHVVVWHEALDAALNGGVITQGAPKTTRLEFAIDKDDVKRAFTLAEDGSLAPAN